MKKQRGKEQFKARVQAWANKLGVKVRAIAVRPMKTKWASCSMNGNLNFSDELLSMNGRLVDFVIVHELLHFSVPNHGRLWKSLMRAHLGEYEKLDAKLERLAHKNRKRIDSLRGD